MPFSALYGKITALRKFLYETGVYRSHTLGARTISVGNITAGGTGKTPFVIFLAAAFAERGEKVCIISRGYRRRNPKSRVLVSDSMTILADALTAGDEPLEMAQRLLGKAIVIADPDRVSAAAFALEAYAPTVFILDDAFQHFRARRDLDIVLIDATDPFGNYKTLPLGILREQPGGLRRAGLIVITRANLVADGELETIVAEVRSFADCPIIASRNRFSGFRDRRSEPATFDTKTPLFAFCGIGNPANFFDQLRSEGFDIRGTKAFSDHHHYSGPDIASIGSEAAASGSEALVTTAKDAVKLTDLEIGLPCYTAQNAIMFDDEEKLREICGINIARTGNGATFSGGAD